MRFAPQSELKRSATDVDLSDLTDSKQTAPPHWEDGEFVIPFDVEPTPAERAAIRRRLMTVDAAQEQWAEAVVGALRTAEHWADTPLKRLLVLIARAYLRDLLDD